MPDFHEIDARTSSTADRVAAVHAALDAASLRHLTDVELAAEVDRRTDRFATATPLQLDLAKAALDRAQAEADHRHPVAPRPPAPPTALDLVDRALADPRLTEHALDHLLDIRQALVRAAITDALEDSWAASARHAAPTN